MNVPPLETVGEQIQNFTERANQWEERLYQKTGGNRTLATLALLAANVGLMVGASHAIDSQSVESAPSPIACAEPCEPDQPQTSILAARVESPASSTTETTRQELAPRPKVEGLNPIIEANMNAMKLSPEGYKDFFKNIDRSWMPYTQTKSVFNNDLIGKIAQLTQQKKQKSLIPSDDFLWHTFGYNPSTLPDGHVDVKAFVDFVDGRGAPCCGMNWMIDSDKVIQLAPADAKLWSNPPYLMRSVEVRAVYEKDITTRQYELLAYLTIADLINQKLLDPRNPEIRGKGHDEMREAWNNEHPHEQYDDKIDFSSPTSQNFRLLLAEFVRDNPEIFEITEPL